MESAIVLPTAHDSRAAAFEKDSKTAIFSNVQMMGAVTVV
jgi:hypothetical protein